MPNNGQLKVWNCPLCHIMHKNNNGLHHSCVLSIYILYVPRRYLMHHTPHYMTYVFFVLWLSDSIHQLKIPDIASAIYVYAVFFVINRKVEYLVLMVEW